MKTLAMILMLAFALPAAAGEHGGGEGGAADILKLDPLVINLSQGHFIQFTPQLKLADPAQAEFVKAHTPLLRHTFIVQLIGKDFNVVETAAFATSFSDDAASALNDALRAKDVKAVFFDGWLVQ